MERRRSYYQRFSEYVKKLEELSSDEQIMESYHSIEKIKKIRTEPARQVVWYRINRNITIRRIYDYFSRAAAILIFPILIVAIFGLFRQKTVSENEFVSQKITVPSGIRSQIVLPDSTHVWLNSGSSIRYNIPFAKGVREVNLSGEGYFEVTHDPDHPFSVHTNKGWVKVLGTAFNIKSYEEEPEVEVALMEGKLSFTADNEGKTNEVILRPGERAVFEKNKGIIIHREPLDKYIAWRYEKLVFDETPMEEVARCLERWFGVKVVLTDPRLKNYRFTTTFENQSLQQVLELLELSSPIKSRYKPAHINKMNQKGESAKVYFSYENKKNESMIR